MSILRFVPFIYQIQCLFRITYLLMLIKYLDRSTYSHSNRKISFSHFEWENTRTDNNVGYMQCKSSEWRGLWLEIIEYSRCAMCIVHAGVMSYWRYWIKLIATGKTSFENQYDWMNFVQWAGIENARKRGQNSGTKTLERKKVRRKFDFKTDLKFNIFFC